MPRIKADTVAEHRENQKNTLLKIAKELICRRGLAAVSFGEIADKADLARPSVYEYFRSKSELASALIESEFPPWIAAVKSEMGKHRSPKRRIEAFFDIQAKMFAKGDHDLAISLMNAELDLETRSKVSSFHEELLCLLEDPLKEIGFKTTEQALALMNGVLEAMVRLSRNSKSSATKLSQKAAVFALGGLKAILSSST
jgi:AcrR family transcriptional regulator